MPLYYSTHIWNGSLYKIVSHHFCLPLPSYTLLKVVSVLYNILQSQSVAQISSNILPRLIMATRVYCMPAWIVLVHNFPHIPPPCAICWKIWCSLPHLNAVLMFKSSSMSIYSLNHLHSFRWAPPPELTFGTCWNSSQVWGSKAVGNTGISNCFSVFIVVWTVSKTCCTVSDEVPKPSSIERIILHLIFNLGNVLSGPVFPWSKFQIRAKKIIHHIVSSDLIKWAVVQNCSSFFSAQFPVQVMKVILTSMHQ
jgi:hypothetical protein